MNTNVVAIIQARMNATRLPGKMLLPLHNVPIIEWVYRRILKSKNINKVVIAIPDTRSDDVLFNFLRNELNATVFRGSERNVLNRIYQTAIMHQATAVVRVCADNPLIAPEVVDELVAFYMQKSCDYAYNHVPKNNLYPDGLGAEIVSFQTLEKLEKNAYEHQHREHCFNYIWDNRTKFSMATFNSTDQTLHAPHLRFDVDNELDLKKLERLNITLESTANEIIKQTLLKSILYET